MCEGCADTGEMPPNSQVRQRARNCATRWYAIHDWQEEYHCELTYSTAVWCMGRTLARERDAPKSPAAAALRGYCHLSAHDTALSSYSFVERLDGPGNMPAARGPQAQTTLGQAPTQAPMQGADGLFSFHNTKVLTSATCPQRSDGAMMAETGRWTAS